MFSYTMVCPFVRGDNSRAFPSPPLRMDYFQYRRTNRGITILYHPNLCLIIIIMFIYVYKEKSLECDHKTYVLKSVVNA